MPDSRLVEAVMYIQHKDGRWTCKHCGRTWRPYKELKRRLCRNCQKTLYPAPRIKGRCHPVCRKGLCYIEGVDWVISRSTWWAAPGKRGIVWKMSHPVPTTLHDVMLEFKLTKSCIAQFLHGMVNRNQLVRRYKKTPPPPGIDEVKQNAYSHWGEKPKRVKWRRARPTYHQYFPTHWAMVDFLSRHPEAVEKVKGGIPLWKPMTIQRGRTLVKFLPTILPITPHEKQEIARKIREGMARNNRMVGWPMAQLPTSPPLSTSPRCRPEV